MENRRHVERILTVFDIANCGALDAAGVGSTRVMLFYEEKENRKHFTILDRSIPENLRAAAASWLEQNFDLNSALCRG